MNTTEEILHVLIVENQPLKYEDLLGSLTKSRPTANLINWNEKVRTTLLVLEDLGFVTRHRDIIHSRFYKIADLGLYWINDKAFVREEAKLT